MLTIAAYACLGPQVTCGLSIVCEKHIVCDAKIICGERIFCGANIVCGQDIVCLRTLGGACPTILPKDFPQDLLPARDLIRDIWGIRDPYTFVRTADDLAVQQTIDRLPQQMQKPIRMLIEHLRKEIQAGTKTK